MSDTVTLDVQELAALLATADGGCYVCAGNLAERMKNLAPEYDWPTLVDEAAAS